MPQDQIKAEKEMTEDDAWEELEQRLKREKTTEYLQRAHMEAAKFIEDHQADLGIMTLRKAFELGFRYGYTASMEEKK